MEKFLNIPVLDADGTNSQNQLVSISGLTKIGQATTTTVVLHYLGGKQITLTWPNAAASPKLLLSVESAVKDALTKGWTNVSENYSPSGSTEAAGVFTNPLSAIAIA